MIRSGLVWRLLLVLIALALAGRFGPAGANEAVPYYSYTVDEQGVRLRVPQPYVVDREIFGPAVDKTAARFRGDLFVDDEGNLYVVETSFNRVLKFDREAKLVRVFGEDLDLSRPQGLFVAPNGDLFIADTGNSRILHTDQDGHVIREFHKPETALLDTEFQPIKVVVDRRGYLYVLEEAATSGIILIDTAGNFRGFFGPTRIGFDLRRIFISLFATEEQKQYITLPEPSPHVDLFLASDGFLYTAIRGEAGEQIQKLNAVGVNTFTDFSFDDPLIDPPRFESLWVDRYGVVSALDASTGQIYQYDQSGRLLMVFGGHGSGEAKFDRPVSVATDPDGRLYVLDGTRSIIYRLRPTNFARQVHRAGQLHFEGDYEGAAQVWREVLSIHSQYELAHGGIAKAYLRQGNYDEAMAEYRLAFDREGYSDAFREFRFHWLQRNFGLLLLALGLLLSGIILLTGRIVGRLKVLDVGWFDPDRRPAMAAVIGVLRSPGQTLWELRDSGSLWAVPVLLLLAYFVRVASLWLMAFHMLYTPTFESIVDWLSPFNVFTYYHLTERDWDQINIPLESLRIGGPFLAWVVVSYGVGVIYRGEGTFRAILRSSAYCLVPYILFTLPVVSVTHVLVGTERGLVNFAMSIIYLWCALLFFLQLRVVHDFDLGTSVRTLAITFFGMAILFGFGALLYLISSQMLRFGWEVVYELSTG